MISGFKVKDKDKDTDTQRQELMLRNRRPCLPVAGGARRPVTNGLAVYDTSVLKSQNSVPDSTIDTGSVSTHAISRFRIVFH